jgi:hypothetical protein
MSDPIPCLQGTLKNHSALSYNPWVITLSLSPCWKTLPLPQTIATQGVLWAPVWISPSEGQESFSGMHSGCVLPMRQWSVAAPFCRSKTFCLAERLLSVSLITL